MKTLSIALLSGLLLIAGCRVGGNMGNGHIVNDTRSVADFSEIEAGGGFQIGYLLTEPLPPTAENKRWVVALNKRLQELTGGDSVQDTCRVFRLPYTMNWPNAGKIAVGRVPTPAGLVNSRDGRRYTRQEIDAAYPATTTTVVNKAAIVELFPGTRPDVFTNRISKLNDAAMANMPTRRFEDLPTEAKNSWLRELTTNPEFVKLADADYKKWLERICVALNQEC